MKTDVTSTLSKEQLMCVLLAPHSSEKGVRMQNYNQYAFRVRRDASKPDIKAAVELMFEVKVAGVQIVSEPGKARRLGKTIGRTQDIKKAYVRLISGHAIDFAAGAK